LSDDQNRSVIILISGTGTNLQALIDATQAGSIDATIAAVYSDRGDAPGLERAREAGIESGCITRPPYPSRAAWELALADAVARHDPALIVLAGFMRVLSAAFVQRFAGRIINIHPSLLPRHPGLDTHRRALESGDTHHGATVHFVTEALDAGPRIVQYRFSIDRQDTPESLAERTLRGEHRILPRAAGWFVEGRLRLVDGRVMLDRQEQREPVMVKED
jgi:phosphoribosylglycinamide formyltransferase 1